MSHVSHAKFAGLDRADIPAPAVTVAATAAAVAATAVGVAATAAAEAATVAEAGRVVAGQAVDVGSGSPIDTIQPAMEPPACPTSLPVTGLELHGCGNQRCPSTTMGDVPRTLKACPCHDAAYCSRQCQKQDWAVHQKSCTTAKANADQDWMTKGQRVPGEKRAAMHGTKYVQSKCLECKRTITIAPDIKYATRGN